MNPIFDVDNNFSEKVSEFFDADEIHEKIKKSVQQSPMTLSTSPTLKSANISPVLRITHNFQPFDFMSDLSQRGLGINDLHLHQDKEKVLVELSMSELKLKIDYICDELVKRGRGLPPGFVIPEFIEQHSSAN